MKFSLHVSEDSCIFQINPSFKLYGTRLNGLLGYIQHRLVMKSDWHVTQIETCYISVQDSLIVTSHNNSGIDILQVIMIQCQTT